MISFRTEIHIPQSPFRINHQSPALFIGSCFTENIGEKLVELAFPVLINPTGIVYNPMSVKRSLEVLISGKEYTERDILFFNERYFSFDHDTSYSHADENTCLEKINTSLFKGKKHIKNANFILITFGTAWVYLHKKSNRLVSNCHKMPSAEFERKLLSVEEIVIEYTDLIEHLRKIVPGMKFIFTISPVRHWKDGAVGNQLSKSSLILAVNKLTENFRGIAEYFPAYELLLDDLRDYRFYADDLLHPSSKAVDYIWEKFAGTYFEHSTTEIMKEITVLANASKHKPFNTDSPAWNHFLTTNLKKAASIKEKFPFLDLSFYESHFSSNR